MVVRPLPDYLQKVAENELNEVPSRVPEDINAIKEWMAKQTHIRACMDDQWILMFLRGCKFRLQMTKEKMEEFYLLRTLMGEYFKNRNPLLPEIQKLLQRPIILPLPLNKRGPQVCILRTNEGDIDTIPLNVIIKVGLMLMDVTLMHNDHIIFGQYIIFDMEHLHYKYVGQLTPSMIRMLVRALQNACPVRPKGFFILNAPAVLQTVFQIAYPLLNKKITSKIYFYTTNDLSKLKELIPKEILPKEYGGEGDSVDQVREEFKTKLEYYSEWLLKSEHYRVIHDDKVKNFKLFNDREMEGSFRNLQID